MSNYYIDGLDYQSDIPIRLFISEEIIKKIEFLYGKETENLPYIAPGLTDIQINGFSGVDFNSSDLKVSDIQEVTNSLSSEGITNFCPTLITNSLSAINEEIDKITEACAQFPEVEKSICGIHLEGPFISSEEGPRGAHNLKYILPPNWQTFSELQDRAKGKIKIISLSPEYPDSNKFIAKCVKNGVNVAIGHTSASPRQISKAVEAGARLSTHLGNGCHLKLPRHENYLWQQLAEDKLWTSIIADGFHLPDSLIKVFMKVKAEKIILISDSTKFTNLKPGKYDSIIGGKVVLNTEGRLSLAENPELLAGSARSILSCVNHLLNKNLSGIKESWDMASIHPNKFLNLDVKNGLAKGAPADLVLFKIENNSINILKTIKAGEISYSKL